MEQLPEGATIVKDKRLPSGPSKGVYHNPRTGQEFPNLPTDPFSIEHYTKRHRLGHDYSEKQGDERLKEAFGEKLVYAPAPPDLKRKWEEREIKSESKTVQMGGQPQSAGNEDLMNLIKNLTQEVMSLKSQINEKNNDPFAAIIEVEEEIEPEYEVNTQIPMFD